MVFGESPRLAPIIDGGLRSAIAPRPPSSDDDADDVDIADPPCEYTPSRGNVGCEERAGLELETAADGGPVLDTRRGSEATPCEGRVGVRGADCTGPVLDTRLDHPGVASCPVTRGEGVDCTRRTDGDDDDSDDDAAPLATRGAFLLSKKASKTT